MSSETSPVCDIESFKYMTFISCSKFHTYSLPCTVYAENLFYNGEQQISIWQLFLKPQIQRE